MSRPVLVSTAHGTVAVLDIPLACCGLESARMPLTVNPTGEPIAVVLCISGTLTTRSAPQVQTQIESARALWPGLPFYRVAVGACASSGGPYWDAPSVVPGVEADLLVPGCPPSPQAIADAIVDLVRR